MRIEPRITASLAILTLAMAISPAIAGPAQPHVSIRQGIVSGLATPEANEFKGIPYAAPPTGVLRWQPPHDPVSWSGARNGTTFGHPCAQTELGPWNASEAANSSEDCLYLNVYTPKQSPRARLPVMVWIHGGAFIGGASNFADGAHFATRGVILVTINYRLGIFGFLAHPELSASSPTKSSGNYGLEDQIAALMWVRGNIAAFGGNPDNITLFGQSAGGASVQLLMISPLTRGLFQNAIIQSGASSRLETPGLHDAEQRGLTFINGQAFAEARSASTAALLLQFAAFSKIDAPNFIGPIVDGHVLTEKPLAAFQAGHEHKIPLIVGNNSREGFGLVSGETLVAAVQRTYGARADEALSLYGIGSGKTTSPDPVMGTVAAQFQTDRDFRCPAVVLAERHAMYGSPTWEYQFEQSLPGRSSEGAAHSYEIPYVFGTFSKNGVLGADFTSKDRELSNTMLDFWTNFAKTGNPSVPGETRWPEFDSASRTYIKFATDFQGNSQTDHALRGKLCSLYEEAVASK